MTQQLPEDPMAISRTDLAPYTGAWTLDPARTTITFHTKALWIFPVKGTARAVEGDGRVGDDGTVGGRLVIDATSIDTGTKKRDQHLQTADFFETNRYPTIEFELSAARPLASNRFAVDGTLVIHGQRQPVTINADVTSDGTTTTVTGTIDDLDRRQWGLSWAKMGAGVHNKVVATAVFKRP
jgi:polyisoprenoid-binding protein YceI